MRNDYIETQNDTKDTKQPRNHIKQLPGDTKQPQRDAELL